jgi:DNA-binding transcriptional LysR family regulator
MIDFTSLEIFISIARNKKHSFSQAAEEFKLTQPAVSARMKQLQEFFKDPLFERDRQNVTLTPKGRELLASAEPLMRQYHDMIEAICDRSPMRGLVRLGVSETIVHTWLPTLFTRVKAAYPNLEFEIDVNITPYLRDRLIARDLDLAFCLGPIDHRNVHNCPLCNFPVAFVACDRIRDEIGLPNEPIALERIAEYELVTFSRNTQPHMALRELLLREGLHPKIHASASMEIVVRMALEGLAIAVIPPAIIASKVDAREKLRPLSTTIELPELNFVAGWPDGADYRAADKVAQIAVEVAGEMTKG